ncbi:MAG TPA: ABC transporter ATP-binding protein [Rectinemataceae bacterium]
MADLRLSGVSKAYGARKVLDGLDLSIQSGECFTLLGPSGCGKTVILRLIAGFESPDSGTVSIGDTVVADARHALPPEERHIGVVFQDYAVWPHKTVHENIAYPLEIAKAPKEKISSDVRKAIEQVGLKGLANRYPYQLSGGQQQRVALARALVTNPAVMLLDEPLTNLDANLREEMRFEIKELQRKTGTTIFYVTHDQEVALAISDRIAIMDSTGRIRQIGQPDEVYERPVDDFVHQFLGIPNYIPFEIEAGSALIRSEAATDAGQAPLRLPLSPPESFKGTSGRAGCRPMDIILDRNPTIEGGLPATVLRLSLLGPIVDFLLETGGVQLRAQIQTEEALAKDLLIEEGSKCGIRFSSLRWFEKTGEAAR